ncbi:protein of unknown function [Azospirillum baldaniorum]|uniref:Uncharacterized protein n=1 Tax=Azospirillum baldaniorum TaxID=1064539 RepID=A0A9P1JNC9_9PROT|nr:protein of unknown function [Azospirillum baldaniorum]
MLGRWRVRRSEGVGRSMSVNVKAVVY